jgi:hypothetical protein
MSVPAAQLCSDYKTITRCVTSLRNAGVTGSSPVSGTTFPQIVKKKTFEGSSRPNRSTRLSHSRVPASGVSYSKLEKVEGSLCCTMVSHMRPAGLWRRGVVYQDRVRVPQDLVAAIGKTHLNR